ncbi:hypothetical protein PG985_007880 [Apiospora marii]|uniref:Uncharacterized protein n=1 Tax=Apiospora marii TaxID=335849 RepID=A0ABR1R9S8_9PEZI
MPSSAIVQYDFDDNRGTTFMGSQQNEGNYPCDSSQRQLGRGSAQGIELVAIPSMKKSLAALFLDDQLNLSALLDRGWLLWLAGLRSYGHRGLRHCVIALAPDARAHFYFNVLLQNSCANLLHSIANLIMPRRRGKLLTSGNLGASPQ